MTKEELVGFIKFLKKKKITAGDIADKIVMGNSYITKMKKEGPTDSFSDNIIYAYHNEWNDFKKGVKIEKVKKIASEHVDSKMSSNQSEKYFQNKYINFLEEQIKVKDQQIDISLTGISTGISSMFVRMEVMLDQDAVRDAGGDKQKGEKKRQETDKRIADKVQELHNKGIFVSKDR